MDRVHRDSSDVSVWPVFVAAVECFRQQELRVARRWLQNLGGSGIGNRNDVSKVVHGVWRERRQRYHRQEAASAICAQDEAAATDDDDDIEAYFNEGERYGDIIVHWREVMWPMGKDVLLV
jgi:hypothetical protein